MSDPVPPRFRKTKSGKWAAMGPVETLEKALAGGGIVEVQKKSGDWSKFHIASLGKPFDVDGVQMVYGYGPDDEEEGAKRLARENRKADRASGSSSSSGESQAPPPSEPVDSGYLSAAEPQRDESEPLPVFQGEDEWVEEF